MKKFIATILCFFAISLCAKAQWYVGGSAGVNVLSGGGNSTTAWDVSPVFGYDFNESIGAGLSLSFGGSPFTFAASPYFRWYFAGKGDFKLLADVYAKFGTSDSNALWGFGVKPGIAYNISEKWAVVTHLAGIGYEKVGDTGLFNFNILGNISIGFCYIF